MNRNDDDDEDDDDGDDNEEFAVRLAMLELIKKWMKKKYEYVVTSCRINVLILTSKYL